ncbi:MAG: chorismate-binding protein [Bacteroidota bacterium]
MICPDPYLINLLIKKGIPFAVYKNPEKENTVIIAQRSPVLSSISIQSIDNISGFIIAPFEINENNEIFVIQSDFIHTAEHAAGELENFLKSLPDVNIAHDISNYQLNRNEYLDDVRFCINKIKSGTTDKVVLSRVSVKDLSSSPDYAELFKAFCQKYDEAFVYMLYSRETGLWTGASPEILLKKDGKSLLTMAVAGTRLLSAYQNSSAWAEKEIEEQRLVSVFIENLLSEFGITTYKTKGPETITAGNIVHLKTTFSIDQQHLTGKIGTFISQLHPTPAVCGLPAINAFQLIKEVEKHERRLYTGFLGPWNLEGESQLFVNIRCAELNRHNIKIYVGGGLTAASVPTNEWEETNNKLQTLFSVIENLMKFA